MFYAKDINYMSKQLRYGLKTATLWTATAIHYLSFASESS